MSVDDNETTNICTWDSDLFCPPDAPSLWKAGKKN